MSLKFNFVLQAGADVALYFTTMLAMFSFADGSTQYFYAPLTNGEDITWELSGTPKDSHWWPDFWLWNGSSWVMWNMQLDTDQTGLYDHKLLLSGTDSLGNLKPYGGSVTNPSLVSAPTAANRGNIITVVFDWSCIVPSWAFVTLVEPPDYKNYLSYSSTIVKPAGNYRDTLSFMVSLDNVVGINKIYLDIHAG